MSTTRVPATARRPAVRAPQPTQPTPLVTAHTPAPQALVRVRRIFRAETANYFLVLGTTLFLVIFGLVIVLSSSSVESFVSNHGNPFTDFLRQGMFALIGIPLMLVASLMPASFWRRWAWLALGGAMLMQLLVFTGLGAGNGYNRNWIAIAGYTFQPSEFIKLTLIVWMAYIFSRKADLLDDWRHALLPVAPVAIVAIGLVLGGNDIGTAAIILAIVFSVMFYAGMRLRHLLAAVVVVVTLGAGIVFAGSSRASRIDSWLTGCTSQDVTSQACWQPVHGMWGLASGGIFGVGLGNSKMKWSWLPEADNDFIFAIIGEELGLIGVIVVLALFIVLAIGFVRIARHAQDDFGRIIAGGVLVWIIGQALVNIAVVLGLLPVLGVPLPLISAGGSALITSLLGIGIVLSFARKPREPQDAAPRPMRAPRFDSPAERSRAAARARSVAR